jgi:hypothetical protein
MSTFRTILMLAMGFASFYLVSYLQKEMIAGNIYESSLILLLAYLSLTAVSFIVPYYVCKFIDFVLGFVKRIF